MLTPHQESIRERLLKELTHRHRPVDEIARTIFVAYNDTLAVLIAMYSKVEVGLRWQVFHRNCKVEAVDTRDFSKGFRPTPSPCRWCDRMILDPDDFTYQLTASKV